MPEAVKIKNRIKGTRRLLGREFNLTGLNHRIPGEDQRERVSASLEGIGKADALLVYDSPKHGPNTLVNGHKRVNWYPDQEWTAIVLDLTDAEAYKRIRDHDAESALAVEDEDLLIVLEAGILAEEKEAAELVRQLEEQDAAELAAATAGLGDEEDGTGAGGGLESEEIVPVVQIGDRVGAAALASPGAVGWEETQSLAHAKAGDFLATLGDGVVSLLIVDPPYFRVADEKWDYRWKTPADYLAWLSGLADEWRRVNADNGSLYVFASPAMAAQVEAMVIAPRFEVLNSITWAKPDPVAALRYGSESFRGYVKMSERIIFAEQRGADSMALGKSGYDDLHCEYEDLRRPFVVSADVPYTDVWTYPSVRRLDRHPCEKPQEMIEDMVRASSRLGDLVVDCFAGSGVTWAACIATGRRFKGADENLNWVERATERARGLLERAA